MEERDVVIIGGGPAGYAAAIRLSQLGRKATLIEKEALGGTCLNRGCIPTMVLAKAVELLEQAKSGKDYGITFADMAVNFETLSARKNTVIKILVGGVKSLMQAYNIELIDGTAQFESPLEIGVVCADGEQKRVAAKKVIIAAGTKAAQGMLPGDTTGGSIDTQQLLELPAPPSSILILGGGFVGLTFATILSYLGTTVTLIEESETLLPEIDQEIVDILRKELKKNKIQVLLGARPVRLDNGPETGVEIETPGEKISVKAACIVRTGRLPSTDGLGLAGIGIELNEKGGILTDATMETSVKSVFAAGDITMEHMWTPVAYAEGVAAAENIAGRRTIMDYAAIPCWSNTIPAICGAGMTEAEATAKGYSVRVGRFSLAANGMATILGRRVGMIKVVTDAKYGQILGVHMVGHNAQELVHEVLVAMKSELTPKDIGNTFHVHPSLSEGFWEVMRAIDGESIHSFSS
jgi:dihydrolipoamide dehydrogenase